MAENTRETQLRGLATEWRTMTYNWRDCALYALAVGRNTPMKMGCRPSPPSGPPPIGAR